MISLQQAVSQIKTAKYIINVKAENDFQLYEFAGSTFRGAFGHAFKKIACGIKKDLLCKQCRLRYQCIYSLVFDTPVPENSEIMKLYEFAPHPFVLTPLNNKSHYKKYDTFDIEMVLIGNAIRHFHHFLMAIKETGQLGLNCGENKGYFSVLSAWMNQEKVYSENTGKIAEHVVPDFLISNPLGLIDRVRISFLTPTAIRYKEKIADSIEFHMIVRNLLRKMSQLLFFHHDGLQMDIDFSGLIQQSEKIKATYSHFEQTGVKRYSQRQKRAMRLDGITGEAVYSGNITDFYELLKLGEIIHAGKNTSFGFGKIQMDR